LRIASLFSSVHGTGVDETRNAAVRMVARRVRNIDENRRIVLVSELKIGEKVVE